MRTTSIVSSVALGAALTVVGVATAPPASAGIEVGPDFDCDGYADLAVGSPGDDINGQSDAGSVHVLFGSAGGGLTSAGDLLLRQGENGVPGSSEAGDAFGSVIAWGYLDSDGCSDLVVGAPSEDIGSAHDSGAVWIIPGDAATFGTAGMQLVYQGLGGLPGSAEAQDLFGASLAIGDLWDDGLSDDLVVGAPGEGVGSNEDAGAVWIVPNAADDADYTGTLLLTQATTGIPDTPGSFDGFGWAVGTDYFTDAGGANDDAADVVIGVPGETVGGHPGAGAVVVVPGIGVTGPDATLAYQIDQDTAGVPGGAEDDDSFGYSIASGPLLGADFAADLAVGSPGEKIGTEAAAGLVHVIPSGGSALTGTGSKFIQPALNGVPGSSEAGDLFGSEMVAENLSGSGAFVELVIAAPYEDIGRTVDAGAIVILPENDGTVPTAGATLRYQGDGVAPDTSDANDVFGEMLWVGNFDRTAGYDLAIGAPGESLDTPTFAGAVFELLNDGAGELTAGAARWTEDTAGILGVAGSFDEFGSG